MVKIEWLKQQQQQQQHATHVAHVALYLRCQDHYAV